MLITVAEARAYARDYESSCAMMRQYIRAAEMYIADGVGPVAEDDPSAKMLCGLLVCEFDDIREMTAAEKNSTRQLVASLKLQLRTKGVPVSNSDTDTEPVFGGADNADGQQP